MGVIVLQSGARACVRFICMDEEQTILLGIYSQKVKLMIDKGDVISKRYADENSEKQRDMGVSCRKCARSLHVPEMCAVSSRSR